MSITETNINIVPALNEDDRCLSSRALKALLHIPQTTIHHILVEKWDMVHMSSTWVPHMLASDKIQIHMESTSKFLGLVAENST